MGKRAITFFLLLLLCSFLNASVAFRTPNKLDCDGKYSPTEKGITLSAWVYLDTIDSTNFPMYIFGVYDTGTPIITAAISLQDSGPGIMPVFEITTDDATHSVLNPGCTGASDCIPVSQWTHVLGYYNNSDLFLYLNGVELASTANGSPLSPKAAIFSIAYDPTTNSNHFIGQITDVVGYEGDFSFSDIETLYKSRMRSNVIPTDGFNRNRIIYIPLDDFPSGVSASTPLHIDRSGNGHNCNDTSGSGGGVSLGDFLMYQ